MKSLILLVALATATTGHAALSPYQPETENRSILIEARATALETVVAPATYIADGLLLKRVARATLNCASSGCALGAHTLGVTLPAKSLIMRSYIYVVTQLTDTGTCTVAISCEDANNIKTATDISGSAAGAFIEGASTGAVSAAVGAIAADCLITATVADGGSCVPLTGKVNIFVEYVVGD